MAALLILSACSSRDDDTQADDPAAELPAYKAAVDPNGQWVLAVHTDATDPRQLRAIFDAVHQEYRDDGDSWFVTFDCTADDPATPGSNFRLANGKFANTDLGLARTGLASTDDVEFETTDRTDCAPPQQGQS